MSFANLQSFNDSVEINPFFEMWKRQNANIMKWNTGSSMITIAEVEKALKQQNGIPYTTGSQMNVTRTSPGAGNRPLQTVPQFFQNAANNVNGSSATSFNPYAAPPAVGLPSHPFGFQNFQPGNIPTKEQLQQHTSEIMRSAMMRKQYQDERKFRK